MIYVIYMYILCRIQLKFCCDSKFYVEACYSLTADLDSFPVMLRQDADGTASTERRVTARRTAEYVHDTEIIFILPSLQMHLKTEHLQGELEPQDDGIETHAVVSDIN